MKGILYGVGVGPGDPELLTAKAIRLLRECDAVAAPKSAGGDRPHWILLRRTSGRTSQSCCSICR